MKNLKIIISLSIAILMFSGFWSPENKKQFTQEGRKDIQERIDNNMQTLRMLYKQVPGSRQQIFKSWGYATFSNVGVSIIFISGENGKGLAHNNRTGQNIYMNMSSGGLGLGLGAKDFRSVFLFETKEAFNKFINSTWDMDAQADAAAKKEQKGDAVNSSVTVAPGVKMYKLTQDGLLLQATLQATRYYKDEDLN